MKGLLAVRFGLVALFASIFVLSASDSFAAKTVYVGPGGNAACNGTKDVPFSVDSVNCRWPHPFVGQPPGGNNKVQFNGGDTMIIDGSNGEQYMMGLGAPNTGDTSTCYANWAYSCFMRPIPSGTPSAPTRILGKGWDTGCAKPPQLWGTERAGAVINLSGSSNVEVQCLEITDHSDCLESGPNKCRRDPAPFGQWGSTGLIGSDSSNVLIKNVNIHGMGLRGMHVGRIKDWTIEKSKIVANSFVGWDGDIGANNSSNSGTITFKETKIQYNGCGETYPGNKPYNCYSQDQGGYGDGLGTHQTGGNWVFIDSDISHNVSDGIDLLYHNGQGNVTIKNTRAEGNAGNQVKIASDATIENSVLNSNCAYFNGLSITSKVDINGTPTGFNHCRAGGSALATSFRAGTKVTLKNNTISGQGDTIIMSSGGNCNGTEVFNSIDNIYLGFTEFADGSDLAALYYPAGATGNSDGPCGSLKMNDTNSIGGKGSGFWNVKGGCGALPNGICQNPNFIGPLSGDNWNFTLPANSPMAGKGAKFIPSQPGCIPNNSCANFQPPCGQTASCTDNCGNVTTKTGPPCGGGDTTPPVITSLDATTTQKAATVSWNLDEKGTGQVEYGPTTAYGLKSELESSFDYSFHSQNIIGLIPNTTYNYRVTSKDQAGNSATSPNKTFKTLPSACVPNGICSATQCGTTGTDNCGQVCSTPPCTCVPTSCSATQCGTSGTDNCGKPCSAPACPCVPTSCSATQCGTTGTDNCGKPCTAPACPTKPKVTIRSEGAVDILVNP